MSERIDEIIYNTVTKQFTFNVEKDIVADPPEECPDHTLISQVRDDDEGWYVNEHRTVTSTGVLNHMWTKVHKVPLPDEMKAMMLLVFQ